MLFLKCIWVSITYFLLAACTGVDKTKREGNLSATDTVQKLKVLTSGTQCDIINPGQVLIKNQRDFDKVWQESFANTRSETKKPAVDFTTEWVIAAYLGTVNSGGYSIEITWIKNEDNNDTIVFRHYKPGRRCATLPAVQCPYTFVSARHFLVDKTEFKVVQEEYKCE